MMLRVSGFLLGALVAGSLMMGSNARAGAFSDPITSNVCANIAVAGGAMSDPNTAFTSASNAKSCTSLCKQAASQCKSWVNKAASCYKSYFSQSYSYAKKNCKEIFSGSELKACKQDLNNGFSSIKQKIKAAQGSEQDNCVAWGDTCQAACNML